MTSHPETTDPSTNDDTTDPRFLKRLARFVDIHDHPWFFRLKSKARDSGLYGYYGIPQLKSGVIIACDVKGANGNYKRFAYFSTFQDFLEHQAKYPVEERHFYEVIGATTQQQRPYFDIDIPPEEFVGDELDTIIYYVLKTLKSQLLQFGAKADWINWVAYQTEYPLDPETGLPKKYSYHLIINGYYFPNDMAMRQFGQAVKDAIAAKPEVAVIANYIDDIWHSTRQFRLPGSAKIGTTAVKQMCSSTSPDEPTDLEGFVTNIEGCQRIPFDIDQTEDYRQL
jgi:hypothetical protein